MSLPLEHFLTFLPSPSLGEEGTLFSTTRPLQQSPVIISDQGIYSVPHLLFHKTHEARATSAVFIPGSLLISTVTATGR